MVYLQDASTAFHFQLKTLRLRNFMLVPVVLAVALITVEMDRVHAVPVVAVITVDNIGFY